MSRTLGCFLLAGIASGCGPTLEELDERTVELHRAEDHLARALVSEKASEKEFVETSAQLAQAKEHDKVLTAELEAIGVRRASDLIALKHLVADHEKDQAERTVQKQERDQLQAGLLEEIEAGVVRLEERDGSTRLVLPEEALFAPGGSRLGPPAKKILESVARELARLPTRRLLVTGHTDPKQRAIGWAVSLERARQVVELFASRGIEPGRLAAAGYAEYDPIADTATDEGRARNRRVEIVLVPHPDYVPQLPPPPVAKVIPPVAKPPLGVKMNPVGVSPMPLSQPIANAFDDPGLGAPPPPPPSLPPRVVAPPPKVVPVRMPNPPRPAKPATPAPSLDDPGL